MHKYRVALGVAGGLLLTFGVFRLVTGLDGDDLVVLGVWLAAAVVIHDGLVAPITVGTGVVLARVPPRGRRSLQGALVVAALITVVALPLIHRQGTRPASKAILLRDYSSNLALLLGLTAAVALVPNTLRVLREQRTAANTPTNRSCCSSQASTPASLVQPGVRRPQPQGRRRSAMLGEHPRGARAHYPRRGDRLRRTPGTSRDRHWASSDDPNREVWDVAVDPG